jgi:NAD+ kinase
MNAIFKTVAVIGKFGAKESATHVLPLCLFLRERGIGVVVDVDTGKAIGDLSFTALDLDQLGKMADLAIVVGGDGTMLSMARALAPHGVPLIGVNLGRLGFLTDVSPQEMFDAVSEILYGQYLTEKRLMLRVALFIRGCEIQEAFAVNDVVIAKGSTFRLIEFSITINAEFVYTQRADGIIVASPTGSTGYSLSAGGPIVHPGVDALILVPICPHTLTNRPIVIPGSSVVEIALVHAIDARVSLDGQSHFDLRAGDRVTVERASHEVLLLHPKSYGYYDMLRKKLHWGQSADA